MAGQDEAHAVPEGSQLLTVVHLAGEEDGGPGGGSLIDEVGPGARTGGQYIVLWWGDVLYDVRLEVGRGIPTEQEHRIKCLTHRKVCIFKH